MSVSLLPKSRSSNPRSAGSFRQELRLRWRAVFSGGRWIAHLLIWLAVLAWLRASGLSGRDLLTARSLVVLLSALGFSYAFVLLVIPYARYRRSIRALAAGLLLSIAASWLLLAVALAAGTPAATTPWYLLSGSLGSVLLLIWAFFACFYFLDLYDQQKSLNRYRLALADKLSAEAAFLRTQVNPHFLFNTLNNIYLLALKEDENAPVITRRLRELLHYMLFDCAQDRVSLAGEFAFIRNYVALESLRNRAGSASIHLDIKGEPAGRSIAPLLLVNFIENAFKHGVKGGFGPVEVAIRLYLMDDTLVFEIRNTKPENAPQEGGIAMAGGIGIRNVQRRLQILYPGRHSLAIRDLPAEYTVHLSIRL